MTNHTDLEARLERVYSTPMPAEARARVAQVLDEVITAPHRRRFQFSIPRLVGRPLISLGLALLAALSGLFAYNRLQGPTPASAAKILHRAALALNPPKNAVVHEVGTWTYGPAPRDSATIEMWTALNDTSNPTQMAMFQRRTGVGLEYSMVADASGTFWSYDVRSQTVTRSTWTPGKPLFVPPPPSDPMAVLYLVKETINSPQSPAAMQALLQDAAQGKDATLLPSETIDGHVVDVVQISRSTSGPGWRSAPNATKELITVYIDSTTYLIHRIDERGVNDTGATQSDEHLDVTTYEILSPTQVPAGTFTFTPPPGSHPARKIYAPPAPAGVHPVKP